MVQFYKGKDRKRYDLAKRKVVLDNTWDIDSIDAVVYSHEKKAYYYFKNNQYWKYDTEKKKYTVEGKTYGGKGEPWEGVWHNLSAAVYIPRNETYYFFKGNKYQRYKHSGKVTANDVDSDEKWLGAWSLLVGDMQWDLWEKAYEDQLADDEQE